MCGVLVGCGSSGTDRPLAGVQEAERSIAEEGGSSAAAAGPAVIVNGVPISTSDVATHLAEAAGDVVVEEMILSHLVERQATLAGFNPTSEHTDAERRLLAETIAGEAMVPPERVESIIDSVRRGRGLGPRRFADLLARNARLRFLVQDEINVTNDELAEAVDAEFGEKVVARIIVVQTQRQAAELRARVLGDDPATLSLPALVSRFSQAAVDASTDLSAPRGGRMEPMSPSDPRLPTILRRELAGLSPGEVSPVLATADAFAILLVEARLPGSTDITAADRARVEQRLRTRKERIAMDRRARQLLASARVTVFDESLRWSWEGRPRD